MDMQTWKITQQNNQASRQLQMHAPSVLSGLADQYMAARDVHLTSNLSREQVQIETSAINIKCIHSPDNL